MTFRMFITTGKCPRNNKNSLSEITERDFDVK